MYEVGKYVVHNGHGVCKINAIIEANPNENFYNLIAISNNMSIKMSCDKAANFLRPILTYDNLTKILDNAYLLSSKYIKDNKERKNQFQKLISSNDINDSLTLLKMICNLAYDKKNEKKTLGTIDTHFLQQVERKLIFEIAIVYDLKPLDSKKLIYEKINFNYENS